MFCGKRGGQTPELAKKLLKYVQARNAKGIRKLLSQNSDLLSFEYVSHDHQTILTLACHDWPDIKEVSQDTIEALIDSGARCTERSKIDHWEALHYTALNANLKKMQTVIKHLSAEELNSLVFCSKHIPKKYLSCPNRRVEATCSNNALSVLLKYGNRSGDFYECFTALLNAGVDVNLTDSNGVSVMELVKKMVDPELEKSIRNFYAEPNNIKIAFELVKSKEEEKFLKLDIAADQGDFDGGEERLSSCTLLQLCCLKGLTRCAEHLLKKNVDPNGTLPHNSKPPVMIAIKGDYEDIVHLLLEDAKLRLPQDTLLKLQMRYKHMRNFAKTDKYMKIILQHLGGEERYDKEYVRGCVLNADDLQRTALHYAAHYRCSENILSLLSMGAPLTKKDLFGQTPLDQIEPKTLESFFDGCVNVPKNEEELNKVLYALHNKKEEFYIEINYDSIVDLQTDPPKETRESEFLNHLTKMRKMTHLMDHPVVASYLALKWQKFKWVIYINLLLYFIAYVSLLFYGFAYTQFSQASNGLLLSSLLLFSVREVVQLSIFRKHYLMRLENVIDLFLMAGIVYILYEGWRETLFNQNMLVVFSLIFLASTLGIFVHLANLPLFTVQVIIFTQISINFFKYMLFYLFPLLAFFFCFYMLHESKENLFFETLYQTIVLATGDFDADYPEKFLTNPVFGHIIYVVFVVVIGIILQNLLIGLAVNDLQQIAQEAKFIDKKERGKYITNIERIIFKQYKTSSSEVFTTIFRKLLRMSNVFHDKSQCVLVVQPYNDGCVFLKGSKSRTQYIQDQGIINHLENIFKSATLQDQEANEPYSLKTLHQEFQKMQKMLENLGKALNLKID